MIMITHIVHNVMCYNMKSYYFSTYSGYNMFSGRRGANAKKLTWMHLKVIMYNTLGYMNY